jgi:hypothetical protein
MRGRQRQLQDLIDGRGWHGMIATARLRLIAQPVDAGLDKSPPNARDRLGR